MPESVSGLISIIEAKTTLERGASDPKKDRAMSATRSRFRSSFTVD